MKTNITNDSNNFFILIMLLEKSITLIFISSEFILMTYQKVMDSGFSLHNQCLFIEITIGNARKHIHSRLKIITGKGQRKISYFNKYFFRKDFPAKHIINTYHHLFLTGIRKFSIQNCSIKRIRENFKCNFVCNS